MASGTSGASVAGEQKLVDRRADSAMQLGAWANPNPGVTAVALLETETGSAIGAADWGPSGAALLLPLVQMIAGLLEELKLEWEHSAPEGLELLVLEPLLESTGALLLDPEQWPAAGMDRVLFHESITRLQEWKCSASVRSGVL